MEARCQVFHICQFSGRQDSFLCPNGTVFDQRYFVCNWWFNVDCNLSPTFYSLNSQLFKSSDSSVLVHDVVSQDVTFDHPESLPVPGVVGGGSVIPSGHNNFRESHALDDPGFVPSPKDWEIASTSGSVKSWSRPSNQNTQGRSLAPVAATSGYPNEETFEEDNDYRYTQPGSHFNNVPVTTYRPLIPYQPTEMRIINVQRSTDGYPEEETFPEEILPEEPGDYYSRRPVPERQSPSPLQPNIVVTATNKYPAEEIFPEEATEVVLEIQKPVPFAPEEAVSPLPDYDTYTSSPEPSPFDDEFNYGRKLHITVATSAPARLTSPRVRTQTQRHQPQHQPHHLPPQNHHHINHQQHQHQHRHQHEKPQIGSYPVEEDLPLEEMVPITERTVLPEPEYTPLPHSTPSPYYSTQPPQPQPFPVPDPIHERPSPEPEIDYRSKQMLQFVSSPISVIAPNEHTIRSTLIPEMSTPSPLVPFDQQQQQQQQLDFESTPIIQFVSTPIPVLESSTEFSNVSLESMTQNAISFGQSYIPEILDPQSEFPVGGTNEDIKNINNLFEYPTDEQPPIRTEEPITRRPTYPTEYSSVHEPLSALQPMPRHPLTYPTFQTNHQNNKNKNPIIQPKMSLSHR
uniref:Chitin-binding type-2 domain-containing protein n=1 Tax=Strigamia maritima TaxID=126957 RepID=T1IU45_STRMM